MVKSVVIQILPFNPAHLATMALRNHELSFGEDFIRSCRRLDGPAYTMMIGDDVVAIAGVSMFWPGVAEAWMIASPMIYKYPVAFHRGVKKVLAGIIEAHGLCRVQAVAKKGFSMAERWLVSLGFEYEGEMPKYGPDGSDFYRYARIT